MTHDPTKMQIQQLRFQKKKDDARESVVTFYRILFKMNSNKKTKL